MAEKLKIIPLGGLNEIGKNLHRLRVWQRHHHRSVGMGFPDDDMYGVDVVIPDVSYLIKHKDKILAFFSPTGTRTTSGRCPMC